MNVASKAATIRNYAPGSKRDAESNRTTSQSLVARELQVCSTARQGAGVGLMYAGFDQVLERVGLMFATLFLVK